MTAQDACISVKNNGDREGSGQDSPWAGRNQGRYFRAQAQTLKDKIGGQREKDKLHMLPHGLVDGGKQTCPQGLSR